jgi:hypothetical protein
MPPKKKANLNSKKSSSFSNKRSPNSLKNVQVSEVQKNALTNMFKRIESNDLKLKECPNCKEQIKSCLLNDHLQTKCASKKSQSSSMCLIKTEPQLSQTDNEILIIEEVSGQINKNSYEKKVKTETVKAKPFESEEKITIKNEKIKKCHDELISSNPPKKRKSDCNLNEDDENSQILNDFLSNFKESDVISVANSDSLPNLIHYDNEKDKENKSPRKSLETKTDYNLLNFMNGIESVLDEQTFSHLLDQSDREIISTFCDMSGKTILL